MCLDLLGLLVFQLVGPHDYQEGRHRQVANCDAGQLDEWVGIDEHDDRGEGETLEEPDWDEVELKDGFLTELFGECASCYDPLSLSDVAPI